MWVTKDDGKNWTKLNEKIKGNPGLWVSRVVASRHFPGTAYVTYTGYRADDFRPFVYKTTDYGETWTSIVGGPAEQPINVIREDPRNAEPALPRDRLRRVRHDDGGKTWSELSGNMPNQPVHDLAIQAREGELVVGTHGRGFYVADISALEEMNGTVLGQDFYAFEVKPAVKWTARLDKDTATTNFNGQGRPNGIIVNYYQKAAAGGDIAIQVLQGSRVVAETKKAPNAGGHEPSPLEHARNAGSPRAAAAAGTGRRGWRALQPAGTDDPDLRRHGAGGSRRIHDRDHGRRQELHQDGAHPRGRVVR